MENFERLSEEDRAWIAKAILLGCEFHLHIGRMQWYLKLGAGHPLNEAHKAKTGYYGYNDPVELAKDYIEYSMRVAQ
jgi:hypothetical protein